MRILFLLLAASLGTFAQGQPRAQGHVFAGFDSPPGSSFNAATFGVGSDVFVYKGAAISPSVGYLTQFDNGGRGVGVLTLNGSYHFLRGKGKFEPFVTAGYGALFNFGDGLSTFNYGGGANYWFKKRLGFRVEVLNFQYESDRELTSVRFGLSFR